VRDKGMEAEENSNSAVLPVGLLLFFSPKYFLFSFVAPKHKCYNMQH
jgi:hypothetical protein